MEPHFYIDLRRVATSSEAVAFVLDLAKSRTARKSASFEEAMAALIGDLLQTAKLTPKGYGYRPMHAGAFTGEPIGFRGIKDSLDLLEKEGLVERKDALKSKWGFGMCTRMRATPLLISKAALAGIELADLNRHFTKRPRSAHIKDPVRCRKASRRTMWYKHIRGDLLPLNVAHPIVQESVRKIDALNRYMARQVISPDRHDGFVRIFNEGDRPGFNYDFGGRIYSIGWSYQHMLSKPSKKKPSLNVPENMRRNIKINGEATVEIDIKACFPTIIHAMLGEPFDPKKAYDAIEFEGKPLPRAVAKLWVAMTLAKDKLPSKWSSDHRETFEEEGLKRTDYPVIKINPLMVKHLPMFNDWEKNTIKWGHLQFAESSIMLDCVHKLAMEFDVPALPVHDSVIVPASKETLAKEVLSACFKSRIGVEPVLETKGVK